MHDLYQEYIHKSRYARYLDDKFRREHWPETVDRFVDYISNKCGDNVLPQAIKNEIRGSIVNMEVMPSMRAVMTAGLALDRDNTAGYNCSYLPVDDPKSFDEAMVILMNGTGVGFSVERQYICKLPEIPEKIYDTETVIVVKDSKEGWGKALRMLIALLYSGELPKWDLSQLRPAGAILKTFGGRSSGPEPLEELFNFVVRIFKNAQGRKLTSIECHDIMCKIGEVVVVGGVRRSAMISLSNLSDDRMRNAKSGAWWEANVQRALANNSAVYTEKPDVGLFMQEWLSLYESKSGERGIFSRDASKRVAKKSGRREAEHEFGTNPCLHPDSMVETIHGRVKIKDITKPTMVYSMDSDGKLCIRPCSASWISKKDAKTIKVTIASGKEVICTPDHKIFIEGRGWIEAQDIKIGDKVVHLVRNRRGASYSGVKLTTQNKRDFVMEHRLVYESYYGKIPDGYDVHHIDGDTYNNDIDNLECLSHSDHSKITALEQPNDHMMTGYHGKGGNGWGFVSPPNSRHGEKIIVPMPEELKSNLHQYATVVSISEGPITDVYDLTVEDTHNFIADFVVVHNCSEIILRPYQFCNLTEVVARSTDTEEDLLRKVRIATILGTIQSTLTYFPYLRKIWKKNTEEERLLGVSFTGIYDCPLLNNYKDPELPARLERLKQVAIDTNKEYSEIFGIPQSAAITCVKPSGTVSQLVDSASGIHPRHDPFYYRRVRSDNKDPITEFLIEAGVPHEPDVTKPNSTTVFTFPKKVPNGAMVRSDISAIDHLELWLMYQRYWCEHKPSVTISVKEEEWPEVGAWVWNHFDEVSGVSFLPFDGGTYRQAPYETVTEKQYEELLKIMPKELNWDKLFEDRDNVEGVQTLACTAAGCEL